MAESKYIWGTGRRKTSVARVRIIEGSGKVEINGRTVEDFFSEEKHRNDVYAPLRALGLEKQLDVYVRTNGGGISGQSGAVVLGIARAIKKYKPDADHDLRAGGFLTRDSRMKERKKYGQKGARKKFQFSKR